MAEVPAKTILVVEDDADEARYLRALLEDHGFAVITAADGAEGLRQARAQRPDLITLDISMPRHSGVRMLRELGADPATARIPVVIITGVSHDLKRFLESRRQIPSPAAYFDKPPDRKALLAAIRNLLNGAPQAN
jgi:CheY-like chemotaxis protein